jgi:LytTr DNA-binding domain
VVSFVRALLLGLGLALASGPVSARAAASPATSEIANVQICKSAAEGVGDRCSVAPVWTANTQNGVLWLNAKVRIGGEAAEPQGVFIKAFAASAVTWDGRLIGRNGRPAGSAALEVPGFRDAVIAIPSDLSRPGVHRLQIQMSTMRAPLRLASPVLSVRVAPFEEALQPALRNYLPALLTAGGMVVVILCLSFLAWRQRRAGSFAWLIPAAVVVTAQLAAESSRAFVALLYPAQIVRLELVLLCSCGFGLLLPTYLCRRFEAGKCKSILAGQAALMILGVFLLPGFDEKTEWAILSSVALCIAVSAIAVREKKPGALPLCLMLGAGLILGLGTPATFLDRDFYVWALALFALLLVQQAQGVGDTAADAEADPSAPAPLWLGSGVTRHLVSPGKIVRLAAADDYTEVFLAGASAVLHPEPLHKLLDRLPPSFVRVHRSHAVNLAHLESFRRGPRSSVTLSDQSVAPVSRRRVPKLIAAISA